MSTVTINPFRGEAIREQRLNKANTYSVCAINSKLHDGTLSSFHCPEEICSHPFKPKAIFSYDGCDCVAWEKETIVDQNKNFIFWHEEGQRTKKSPKECFCNNEEYKVGLPCPTNPPSASGSGAECDFDPRVYYYTFVAKFCGECESESPLSPSSNGVCGAASVGGFSGAPPGYGITHIRIYSAIAGWKSGSEAQAKNSSGVVLVGEVFAGSGFSDPGLTSTSMISPITFDMESLPYDGDGIGVTAFSTFVWKGKHLHISADGMIDVSHDNGRFCFDHDIIMAKYWNGSIYVFTERWNYRIDQQAGDGGVRYSNPPYRFEVLAPIRNKHSVSVGQTGVYYVSKAGVTVLSGNECVIIGSKIFTTDQWKSIDMTKKVTLDHAKTHIYQQYLFVFSEDWEYTHIIEIEDNAVSDIEYSNHVRYPYSIQTMFTTNEGDLRFASGDTIYRFIEEDCYNVTDCNPKDPLCVKCCPYDYRIDARHIAEVTDFAVAYLNIDPYYDKVVFRLWRGDCGDVLVFEKELRGCETHEFKLPGCGPLQKRWTIQLEGCATVRELRIGTNNKLIGLNG